LVLLAALAVMLGVRLRDWCTWLAIMGFVVIIIGLVAGIAAVTRLIVALVRRCGRRRALGWGALTVVAVVAAGLGLAVAAPSPTPTPAAALRNSGDLDCYLARLVASGAAPSVAVVVVDRSGILYQGAAGIATPDGAPATAESAYKWWSCTKIVTAIAVLQLVEQGRVRLDEPVRTYLPWFQVETPSGSREARVADLLNHSAGLRNNVPEVVSWMHLEGEPAHDQLALAREKLPTYRELERPPGQTAVYTNVGYMLLGALVQAVSGEPYETYVERHILRPLGMNDTGFSYSAAMREREAAGSHPAPNIQTAFLPVVDPPFPWDYIRSCHGGRIWFSRFLADATPPTGLIGSPMDMARLVSAVLNGGGLDGARILSPDTTRLMLRGDWMPTGSTPEYAGYASWVRQGLGWQVSRDARRTFWEHIGGGPGWAALMRLYEDEPLGIVVMANGTTLDTATVADAVAAMQQSQAKDSRFRRSADG
jgi:D-alanyl-D-alanine carboxypeptidase